MDQSNKKAVKLENMPDLLTVKEVSELLKLSVLTIYKYIRERRLEVVEFGGHYRIDKLSLDKFIDSHKIRKDKIL